MPEVLRFLHDHYTLGELAADLEVLKTTMWAGSDRSVQTVFTPGQDDPNRIL